MNLYERGMIPTTLPSGTVICTVGSSLIAPHLVRLLTRDYTTRPARFIASSLDCTGAVANATSAANATRGVDEAVADARAAAADAARIGTNATSRSGAYVPRGTKGMRHSTAQARAGRGRRARQLGQRRRINRYVNDR